MAILEAGAIKLKSILKLPEWGLAFGAYNNDTNISAIDINQQNLNTKRYFAQLITINANGESSIVITPILETAAYKFCLQAYDGLNYYFTGEIVNGQMMTSTNINEAIDIYVVSGGELNITGTSLVYTVNEQQGAIQIDAGNIIFDTTGVISPNGYGYSFNYGCWAVMPGLYQEIDFIADFTDMALLLGSSDDIIVASGIVLTPEAVEVDVKDSTSALSPWLYMPIIGWMAQPHMILLSAQEVSDEFAAWVAANEAQAPTTNIINFTVNGSTFSAVRNTSWSMWLNSYFRDYYFETSLDELIVYSGYLISYNDANVNMYDLIVENGNYTIEPQVRLNLTIPETIRMNTLFADRSTVDDTYLLYANRTYSVDLFLDSTYFIQQSFTNLNDYVSYEIINNKLIIHVGNIPNDFMEQNSLNINLNHAQARKLYTKLTAAAQPDAITGAYIFSELLPQYRVEINGPHYLIGTDLIKKTPTNTEDKLILGEINPLMSLFLLPDVFLSSFDNESASLPISIALPLVIAIKNSEMPIADSFYLMPQQYTILSYLNYELTTEELLGLSIISVEKDIDKIKSHAIGEYAVDNNMTESEVITLLKEEATKAGMSYDGFLIQQIESTYKGSIDTLYYMNKVVIDDAIATWFDNLRASRVGIYKSLMSLRELVLGGTHLYSLGSTNTVGKNTLSYESGEKIYPLQYNGTPILSDVIFSDTNDFDATTVISTGEKLNNYNYLVITGNVENNGVVAPVDRYTPGTIYVEEQTCLSGDTLIDMADGSQKRIDAIEIGEAVMTPYGAEKVIFSDAHRQKMKTTYTDYYFSDHSILRVIKDHRVYSVKHKRFVHITSLKLGDSIMKSDGTKAQLVARDTVNCAGILHYTIFTENTNAYFANGILCGNIFANIKIRALRKLALKLFSKFILRKELQR